MLSIQRHDAILKLLKHKKNIKLQEILDTLKISEATARRDLSSLENKGLIRKIHGGAVLIDEAEETDIVLRKEFFLQEKEKIGKRAAELADGMNSIYLDAGTTTFHMIKNLKGKGIKVVTNGLNHIDELIKYGIEAYLIGGKIKGKTSTTVGYVAVQCLKNFTFDGVFIGANTVGTEGFSTPDPEEALVKETAISLGKEIYFLCDNSKFNKTGFIKFADFSKGTIITDKEVPEEYKDKIKIEVVN